MTAPTLLAVHDQPAALDVICRELTGRYATDYEIAGLAVGGVHARTFAQVRALRCLPESPCTWLDAGHWPPRWHHSQDRPTGVICVSRVELASDVLDDSVLRGRPANPR